ncbi:hypothetical protein ACFW1A_24430 [Kitasatospora sp. NPDC058965]|uniref:hypothetical protein n=1 Tax=Kitasatospora sp. NPDC058965 TaxID=3346682 RepID=UPI0036C4B5CD
MAVGDGAGVGLDVGEGGAGEGGVVPGRVAVPLGAGVVAEGCAAGLDAAPALADALAEPDAEGEALGRALPVRCAPAVGSPTTGTGVSLPLVPAVAPGDPASGAETGAVASSECPEVIATTPTPPPAIRPTTDSTSAPRRRPDPVRLPRRRSAARPGDAGAFVGGCSAWRTRGSCGVCSGCHGSASGSAARGSSGIPTGRCSWDGAWGWNGGRYWGTVSGAAATGAALAPQPGQDSAPLRWRRQSLQ